MSNNETPERPEGLLSDNEANEQFQVASILDYPPGDRKRAARKLKDSVRAGNFYIAVLEAENSALRNQLADTAKKRENVESLCLKMSSERDEIIKSEGRALAQLADAERKFKKSVSLNSRRIEKLNDALTEDLETTRRELAREKESTEQLLLQLAEAQAARGRIDEDRLWTKMERFGFAKRYVDASGEHCVTLEIDSDEFSRSVADYNASLPAPPDSVGHNIIGAIQYDAASGEESFPLYVPLEGPKDAEAKPSLPAPTLDDVFSHVKRLNPDDQLRLTEKMYLSIAAFNKFVQFKIALTQEYHASNHEPTRADLRELAKALPMSEWERMVRSKYKVRPECKWNVSLVNRDMKELACDIRADVLDALGVEEGNDHD